MINPQANIPQQARFFPLPQFYGNGGIRFQVAYPGHLAFEQVDGFVEPFEFPLHFEDFLYGFGLIEQFQVAIPGLLGIFQADLVVLVFFSDVLSRYILAVQLAQGGDVGDGIVELPAFYADDSPVSARFLDVTVVLLRDLPDLVPGAVQVFYSKCQKGGEENFSGGRIRFFAREACLCLSGSRKGCFRGSFRGNAAGKGSNCEETQQEKKGLAHKKHLLFQTIPFWG